jgi:hypothetical protein
MKRRSKIIGLALVVVFAMSAVAAASASAFFDSEAETTALKGVQEGAHVFSTPIGSVSCTSAVFKETVSGTEISGTGIFTAETVKVHPEYSGCTAFGFGANVKTEGCNYVFARTGESGGEKTGTVTVQCETGKKITIEAVGFCKMEVGSQGPLSSVNYKDQGSGAGRTVKVTAAVKNIAYTGTCGSGSSSEYKGVANLTGHSGSEAGPQVGVWVT